MTKAEIPDSATEAAATEASDWVVRLQGETTDEGDWLAFERWLAASDGNGPAYDRALALTHEIDALAPALRRRMGAVSLISWRMSAAVGALAAGLVLGWVLIADLFFLPGTESYETATGERKTITLADGSHIDLDGATRITVRLERSARRVTMDRGEAIYQVAADAARPFIILAGDRRVRVVGTEFDLRQRAGAFSLTVRHGVVEISPADGAETGAVRLTQGERFDHRAGQQDRHMAGVSVDDAFSWREGRLIYREQPLTDVVADLNAHYSRPIMLADPSAAAQSFSGVLTLDGEDDVVHRLTLLSSLWSTSNDTGYVLHAKGGVGR